LLRAERVGRQTKNDSSKILLNKSKENIFKSLFEIKAIEYG